MKEEKSGARKGGDFLAGKGFYIVLFACVAIIGVSAWILFFTGNTGADVETMSGIGSGQTEVEVPPSMNESRTAVSPAVPESEDAFSTQPQQKSSPGPTSRAAESSPSPSADAQSSPSPVTSPSEKPKEEAKSTEPKAKTIEELSFVWPVAGTVETPFSVEMPVFNRTLGVWRTHSGMDINSSIGTKVLAITDGKVVDVYNDDMMGMTVVIDHGNSLKSIYSNLAGTPVVKTGDNVTMGSVIGAVGDTALGEIGEVAHLHLEMSLDGDAVDPAGYLPTR